MTDGLEEEVLDQLLFYSENSAQSNNTGLYSRIFFRIFGPTAPTKDSYFVQRQALEKKITSAASTSKSSFGLTFDPYWTPIYLDEVQLIEEVEDTSIIRALYQQETKIKGYSFTNSNPRYYKYHLDFILRYQFTSTDVFITYTKYPDQFFQVLA